MGDLVHQCDVCLVDSQQTRRICSVTKSVGRRVRQYADGKRALNVWSRDHTGYSSSWGVEHGFVKLQGALLQSRAPINWRGMGLT
jgi:hypothetical protein